MITAFIKRAILGGVAMVLSLAAYASGHAETIVSVTQVSYNYSGQPVCSAARMNPASFTSLPSDPCVPDTSVSANGPDRITKNVYDTAGQSVAVYEGVGTSDIRQYATYGYTPNGQKSYEIDANGNKTTFTYDGFDRLSKLQYPSISAGSGTSSATDYETFTYDANNNRTGWRRRNNLSITYTFDNLNREIHQGGTSIDHIDTSYDGLGRLKYKHFTATGLGVDYSYDSLGRVTSTTDMFGRTTSYQHNAASARTRTTYHDGNYVEYSLDNLGRIASAGLNGTTNVLFTQVFDNTGNRLTLGRGTSAAGGATNYAYDGVGRLTSFTNNLSGSTHDITWTFSGYNPVGQITSWGASSDVYDYVETVTLTDSRSYDGLNRDASIAAISDGYDANGNLASEGTSGRVMKYDFYNRLISVANGTTPSTPFITLSYDPEGRLASYTFGGSTREFFYDGTDLIGEYTHGGANPTSHSSDTMAYRYVHGPGEDEALVVFSGATVTTATFLWANYQGSIIAVTDSLGVMVSYYKYGPYGEPKSSANVDSWSGPRFRFTGQTAIHEAYLYYYKARVYDPAYGRFLQTDPVGSKDDLDLYAYVGGDPINATDPTGTVASDNSGSGGNGPCEDFAGPVCSVYGGGGGGGGGGVVAAAAPSVTTSTLAPTAGGIAGGIQPVVVDLAAARWLLARAGVVGLTLSVSGSSKQITQLYVTYTRTGPTGQVYSGRTSINVPVSLKDPARLTLVAQAAVIYRSSQQSILNQQGFAVGVMDRYSFNAWAIRGREQFLINFHGGAQSIGGTARNMINGVSVWNQFRRFYRADAIKEFGTMPNNSSYKW